MSDSSSTNVPPSPSSHAPVDGAPTTGDAPDSTSGSAAAPAVVATTTTTARKMFTREAHQLLRAGALVSGVPLASELSSINAVPVVKHAKHAIVTSATAGHAKPQSSTASRGDVADEQRSDNERPPGATGSNSEIPPSDASRGPLHRPTGDSQRNRQTVVSSGAPPATAATSSGGNRSGSGNRASASEGRGRGLATSGESPQLNKSAVEALGTLHMGTLSSQIGGSDATDSDDDTLQYANSAVASFTVPLLSQSERDSLATLQKQFQVYQAAGQQMMSSANNSAVAPSTPTKSVFGSLPTTGAASVSVFAAQTASQSTGTPQPLLSSPQAKLLQSVLASSRVAQASASGGSPHSSLQDGGSPGSAGEQSPPDSVHAAVEKGVGDDDGVPGVFLDSLLNAIRSRKDAEAAGSSTKTRTTESSEEPQREPEGTSSSQPSASVIKGASTSKKLSADAPAFKPKLAGALSVGYSSLPLTFEMFAALNALGLLPPLPSNAVATEPDHLMVVYEHDEMLMKRIEQQLIASRGKDAAAQVSGQTPGGLRSGIASGGTVAPVWDEQAWSSFDRRFQSTASNLPLSAASARELDGGLSAKKKKRTRRSKRRKNRKQCCGDGSTAADGSRPDDEGSSGSSCAENEVGGGGGQLQPQQTAVPDRVESASLIPGESTSATTQQQPRVNNICSEISESPPRSSQAATGPAYVEDDEG